MKTCFQTLVLFMFYILQSRLSLAASLKQSLAPEQALNFKRGRKNLVQDQAHMGDSPLLMDSWSEEEGEREKRTSWHVMVQNPSLDGTMSLNLTESVATLVGKGKSCSDAQMQFKQTANDEGTL